MNPTSINLNPVNAVQAQASAGKEKDAANPDMPFSQVLSSEMAQKRSGSEASEESDTDQAPVAAPPHEAAAEAGKDATAKATDIDESKRDPLDPTLAENNPVMPDAWLALGIHPDLLKPGQVGTDATLSGDGAAPGASRPNVLEAKNGPITLPLEVSPKANFQSALTETSPDAKDKARALFDELAGAQKSDSTLPGKALIQPAIVGTAPENTATAAAFSGQLAAARQSDAVKSGEIRSDLLSNPAMAATPQGLLDAASRLDGMAATNLAPSVGTTAWSQALGEKIVWMATGAQQTASLTLNPPNMGPLQIVLHVSNDQATASFFSAVPEVRQALEAAFPKLREMMNEAGIQLGQATVNADTPQQNNTSDRQAHRMAPAFLESDRVIADGLSTIHSPIQQSGRGLVDTFA
jgi:flagellar hook-length control protein FliK